MGEQGLATTGNTDKTHVDKTFVTWLCEFECVSPPRSRQVANASGSCLPGCQPPPRCSGCPGSTCCFCRLGCCARCFC